MSPEPLEPVYLIIGSDFPKVALALRRLRARFAQGSIEHLFAESVAGDEAVSALNALGLFGGGERLVVVESVERWKKADVEFVSTYLASPTPGAVLALTGDSSRLAGLEAACKRAGAVLRYDIPLRSRGKQPDFAGWARGQLERAGLQVDHEAAERLVDIVGDDTFALQNEVEKLAAWADGGTLGAREVEALAVPRHEMSVFAVGDAWGARDVAGALAACEGKLLEEEPSRIASRLADHVGSVRRVQALRDEDVDIREIAERLRLKDFPARKQAGQAANYSRDELGNALVRLAELDFALKGGSRLGSELELERALIDVTRGLSGNPTTSGGGA